MLNHSVSLYGRFEFLRTLPRSRAEELGTLDPESCNSRDDWLMRDLMTALVESLGVTETSQVDREKRERDQARRYKLRQEIAWLHQSLIEAFFSWTEHALVHVAVLNGRITSGLQVDEITQADWPVKFATAFDITDLTIKSHYDALVEVRREHRNFTSHGAFGKEGEAFQFHSGAGAVSICLQEENHRYTLVPSSGALTDVEALAKLDAFVAWLKEGPNEPIWAYLQRGLTTVLPWANSGMYRRALSSAEDMDEFLEYVERLQDDSANMDW